MVKSFIGVGSNLGDRIRNIQKAIELLKEEKIRILKVSTLIETKPVGGPKQGKFLNGVLEIETKLQPVKLLKTLKSIEKKIGRRKTVRNDPRIIDLDILLYDDKIINSPHLTIPHPRMHERSFVINPLKEIAPEIVKALHLKNK
jgi:2-amino-4-hydroxy-6-hydroxymethyldihydropteridine diphosphokinase